jgi:YHS domain-containing protein
MILGRNFKNRLDNMIEALQIEARRLMDQWIDSECEGPDCGRSIKGRCVCVKDAVGACYHFCSSKCAALFKKSCNGGLAHCSLHGRGVEELKIKLSASNAAKGHSSQQINQVAQQIFKSVFGGRSYFS